jgi:uncharacterized UBP type Zn finger protein
VHEDLKNYFTENFCDWCRMCVFMTFDSQTNGVGVCAELPTPSEESINLLVAMGFSHDAAANALVLNGNDVQRAIDWLFSNK